MLLPIIQNLSSRVDVVLSAHTHQPYNCVLVVGQDAVVRLVGMRREDNVDPRAQVLDDRQDVPAQARAVVDVGGTGLEAALVEQDDERLDVLLVLQHVDILVDRGRFRQEVEAGDPGGGHDVRRPLQGQPDEGDLHALDGANLVRREQCLAVVLATTLADRYWKSAPPKVWSGRRP